MVTLFTFLTNSFYFFRFTTAAVDLVERPRMIQIPIERNDSLPNLYNSGPPTDRNLDSYMNTVYKRF